MSMEAGAGMNTLNTPEPSPEPSGIGVYAGNSMSRLGMIENTLDSIDVVIGGACPTAACDGVDQCAGDMGLTAASMQIDDRLSRVHDRLLSIRERMQF